VTAACDVMCLSPGVLVLTGVNVEEVVALRACFGLGFTYAVGAGVLIATGSGFNEYVGPSIFVSRTRHAC
jgi:hypothetical protein